MQLPPFGMGCSALGNLYRSVSDSEANAAILTALKGGVRYVSPRPIPPYAAFYMGLQVLDT
jgi:hypothetical protein